MLYDPNLGQTEDRRPLILCDLTQSWSPTGGGGTAARASAKARSESRALCGVMVVGSRSGSSGMMLAMTASSGSGMGVLQFACLQLNDLESVPASIAAICSAMKRL